MVGFFVLFFDHLSRTILHFAWESASIENKFTLLSRPTLYKTANGFQFRTRVNDPVNDKNTENPPLSSQRQSE